MTILTLDFETGNLESYHRKANQFDPRNRIICGAYKIDNEPTQEIPWDIRNHFGRSDIKIIVGQNLKFDLLWLWDCPSLTYFFEAGGLLWDTLTVEHLLRGGEKGLPKDLDSLVKRYGGTLKDDKVKAFLKDGGNPAEYPNQDELLEYCKADVDNTHHIFKKQYALAKKLGMLKVIKVYMRHYAAVCDMEFNGIHINREPMEVGKKELEKEVHECAGKIKELAKPMFPDEFDFNPSSNRHISLALFGGDLKITKAIGLTDPESGLPILIKSKTSPDYGKQKTKLVEETHHIAGFDLDHKGIEKDHYGYYKTDERTLQSIDIPLHFQDDREFIRLILEHRSLVKKLGTYFYIEKNNKSNGLMSCLDKKDDCIHPNFKTYITSTTRLACAEPNVQNVHPAVHKLITSRFPGGKVLSVDYSSMEVFVAAIRSGCPILIADLKRKDFNMHKNSATFTFECRVEEVTKEQRGIAKQQTFQLLYGAHYTTMARILNIPEERCKAFVEGFYDRYYGVREWHEQLEDELSLNAEPTNELLPIAEKIKDENGNVLDKIWITRPNEFRYRSFITNQFGQRWCIKDLGSISKNGNVWRYWPTTDMKNYSVQGTASLFVNLGVSLLWEELAKQKNYTKLINEVHDEVWIDVHPDYVEWVKEAINNTMGKISQHFNTIFGVNLGLDIGIEMGIGDTIEEAKGK